MRKLYLILIMGVALLAGCQKDTPIANSDTLPSTKNVTQNILDLIFDTENSTLYPSQWETFRQTLYFVVVKFPMLATYLEDAYEKEGGFKIKFEINPDINGMARFDASTNTISFADEDYLREEQVFVEEFLHVAECYLIGLGYMQAGKNTEYEILVIRDVLNAYAGESEGYYGININDSQTYKGFYPTWIKWLKNGTPVAMSSEIFNKMAYSHEGLPGEEYHDDFIPYFLAYCLENLR